ncbi:MAG: hypothetical protein IKG55_08770 [Solobacterium sp.]|nr:hypothetical protein [Solobacterium sp.]
MIRRIMRITTAVLCITMLCGLSSCASETAAENSPEPASEMSDEAQSRTGKKIYFAGPMFSQGGKKNTT